MTLIKYGYTHGKNKHFMRVQFSWILLFYAFMTQIYLYDSVHTWDQQHDLLSQEF